VKLVSSQVSQLANVFISSVDREFVFFFAPH